MVMFKLVFSRPHLKPRGFALLLVAVLGACQSFFAEQLLSPQQKIMDHCETVSKLDAARIEARLPFVENDEPGKRLNRTRIIEITQKASYQGCLQRFADGNPQPRTKP